MYIINALYLWPITLWTYLNWGRPPKPQKNAEASIEHAHHDHQGHADNVAITTEGRNHSDAKHTIASDNEKDPEDSHTNTGASHHHHQEAQHEQHGDHSGHEQHEQAHAKHEHHDNGHGQHEQHEQDKVHAQHGHHEHHQQAQHAHHDHGADHDHETTNVDVEKDGHPGPGPGAHAHHHMHDDPNRPMFATVTVAVCHCGAGCVLGDIVGEWLVYGTGAMINGRDIGPEMLIGIFPTLTVRASSACY